MWRYEAFLDEWGYWHVCEAYDGYGRTGAILPSGESREELIDVLRMMIRDLDENDDNRGEV